MAFNKYGRRKDTKRKVGILKAVIRVCLRNPILDEEYNTFAKSIKAVNDCVVRLYIIKVRHHDQSNRPKRAIAVAEFPGLVTSAFYTTKCWGGGTIVC